MHFAETILRVALALTGLLNLIPSLLAFAPERIAKSYGIDVPDVNHELLLRHRAVLFGIVGGLMLYAALTRKQYELATIVGLVSMISFVVLYWLVGAGINAPLKKVMLADVVGTIVLLIGALLYWLGGSK